MEEGGAPKLLRKPTKTLPKLTTREYLSRNTLGNRRRETAIRNKQPRLSGPALRRIPAAHGVKQQQEENVGADKRTRTSETRAVPNIRRAPTKAANRRRTKLRTRNESSFVGQVTIEIGQSCSILVAECGATTSGKDWDPRSTRWKHKKKGIRC